MKNEIDRVATQTAFNGVNLLDGSFTNQTFQVGANAGQTIAVSSIVNAQSAALGTWSIAPTANASGASGAFGAVMLDFAGASGLANATVQANLATAGFTVSGSAAGGDLRFQRADGASFDIVVERGAFSHGGGFAGAGFGDGTNTINNGSASAVVTGFAALDISTAAGADRAILAMDGTLTAISTARAQLGAVQSRFQSAVTNLYTTSENLSASRSRIKDADALGSLRRRRARAAHEEKQRQLRQRAQPAVQHGSPRPQGRIVMIGAGATPHLP